MEDLLWGLWNGFTAWPLLIAHVMGALDQYSVYNLERGSDWYNLGFLIGAGAPVLGFLGLKN